MQRLKLTVRKSNSLRVYFRKVSLLVPCVIFIYILIWFPSVSHHGSSNTTSQMISPAKANYKRMRHILIWPPDTQMPPVSRIKNGRTSLIRNRCKYNNCIFSRRVTNMNITKFDAIVFNFVNDVQALLFPMFCEFRNEKHKYIFASMESPFHYSVKNYKFDGFFNWTWTYRLDSDVPYPYFTIHDKRDKIIGPAVNIKWLNNMKPISRTIKERIDLKTRAVAWIASHCWTINDREYYVALLDVELMKYNLEVDIYGTCAGQKKIQNTNVIDKYYFYLAFENSMGRDYVTEKVMNALDHWAIPVVYGGANYSRFLPPNSYIDATKLRPRALAKIIYDILKNDTAIYDFFRWQNHYRYKSNVDSGVCNLCAALNDRRMMEKISTHPNFRSWWNHYGSRRLTPRYPRPETYINYIYRFFNEFLTKLVG